jgi:hypothetical protein
MTKSHSLKAEDLSLKIIDTQNKSGSIVQIFYTGNKRQDLKSGASTISITTLDVKGSFVTLSILTTIMLCVITLSVGFFLLNAVTPNAIMLSVVAP